MRIEFSQCVQTARFGQFFPIYGKLIWPDYSNVLMEMKRVTDTTEVLGTVEMPQGKCEVCASADARYDEEATRLVVKLDAFLRTADLLAKERRFPAEWLPKSETVRETVGPEETMEMARDIFQRWVRKVRQAVPTLPVGDEQIRKASYAAKIYN